VYGVRSRYGPCPGFSVEVCKPNDLPPPITTHTIVGIGQGLAQCRDASKKDKQAETEPARLRALARLFETGRDLGREWPLSRRPTSTTRHIGSITQP